MQKKLVIWGFFAVLAEGAYILLVALIMRNANDIFGNVPGVLGIITFLLLFVVSAAISGAFILGKPVLLYLEGGKKEAVELFAITVGWMLVFLIALFVAMAVAS